MIPLQHTLKVKVFFSVVYITIYLKMKQNQTRVICHKTEYVHTIEREEMPLDKRRNFSLQYININPFKCTSVIENIPH